MNNIDALRMQDAIHRLKHAEDALLDVPSVARATAFIRARADLDRMVAAGIVQLKRDAKDADR